jgi:hypothetical protein
MPKTEVAFIPSTRRYGQIVSEGVESTGIAGTITQTAPKESTPDLQRMNQGCNQSHVGVMTVRHGDRRLASAPWTEQRDEPPLSNPITNLGLRHLAADQHERLRSESSSATGAIAPADRAIFKSDNGADERIAASLDVCDVSIAKLAVTKHLADCGHVDPEAPFLNGYVRPDMIHQLLLRDDLTRAVGKIGQYIQRPIPERKRSTVAPEHPLANRKLKRAKTELPVNCGAIHVSAKFLRMSGRSMTITRYLVACIRSLRFRF